MFCPPDAGGQHSSLHHVLRHLSFEHHLTQLIANPHIVTRRDAAHDGVGGMKLRQRFAGTRAQAVDNAKGRIEIEMGRRGDADQAAARGLALPGRGSVGRQWIVAIERHAFTVEFAFAAGCGKAAHGKGSIGLRQVEARKTIRQQLFPGDAGKAFVGLCFHQLAQNLLVALAKARLSVAHGRGQAAENFAVGQAFAQRGNGRTVERQKQMTVGLEDVPVLQLRRGRQDIVGIVRRVGLELFEYDSKKVVAQQALPHC